jgi:two-component system copper resistance phosphate regulon response regulator CusR
MRILLVEDEQKIASFISQGLTEAGYTTDISRTGEQALSYARAADYDLIVLDIILPGLDGMAVCRKLRKSKLKTPILMLTARDSVEDRVNGLDSGADDYLVKPFAFAELLARMRALLRRPQEITPDEIEVGDLTVNVLDHHVTREDVPIVLTPREYSLLEYMARNRCLVLSRAQILNHVWNCDFYSGSNVVDVYIRYLRTKIDDGWQIKLIRTVWGVGYTLCDD